MVNWYYLISCSLSCKFYPSLCCLNFIQPSMNFCCPDTMTKRHINLNVAWYWPWCLPHWHNPRQMICWHCRSQCIGAWLDDISDAQTVTCSWTFIPICTQWIHNTYLHFYSRFCKLRLSIACLCFCTAVLFVQTYPTVLCCFAVASLSSQKWHSCGTKKTEIEI